MIVFRRGATKLDGARDKKQVWRTMFEPEVFRKQMHCIEESTCGTIGTFRRLSQWFGARGIVPLPPSLRSWYCAFMVSRTNKILSTRYIQIQRGPGSFIFAAS